MEDPRESDEDDAEDASNLEETVVDISGAGEHPPGEEMYGEVDIGHESHWPETGDLAWESNPGPIKKIVLFGRGSNPGPTKNNMIT